MYQFSAPMPYEKRFIDKYVYINSRVEKSKITGVYFAYPVTSDLACGFEQGRSHFLELENFDYWKDIIIYAQEQNLKVTYLFNSPKPLSLYGNNLKTQLNKLDTLIKRLTDIGCTRFRVCNLELLEYLISKYQDLEFCTSTSNEYVSLGQYINLMKQFPQITEIVPSFDVNRNFKLLKNLRKAYPNLDIELMVNEGCLAGCPFRNFHNLSLPDSCCYTEETIKTNYENNTAYCRNNCTKIFDANILQQVFISNIITPWNIEFYKDIGINKFKLVGRNNPEFLSGEYLNYYYIFLKGVDDFNLISKNAFSPLSNATYDMKAGFPYSANKMKEALPKISYFTKNGNYCTTNCRVKCNYCFKMANKLGRVERQY